MWHNVAHIFVQSVIISDIILYFCSHLMFCLWHSIIEAKLFCEFKTEKDQNPRIEWKKKDKETSFVYFDSNFTGEWPIFYLESCLTTA